MLLPFMKPKPQTGLIVSHRTPDEPTGKEDNDDAGLESCAQDLIKAVHSKDIKAVASALKAAFDICDSQPHEEGEHTNDFDSQNALAAENE